ncbi:hypothetical protein M0R72_08985 [Candidatus Pacearchaeota archaeon]|nr:hypothetical protein [Candidatus Pacearchaeota archaeon]
MLTPKMLATSWIGIPARRRHLIAQAVVGRIMVWIMASLHAGRAGTDEREQDQSVYQTGPTTASLIH